MVQKEVAQRICAKPPDMSLLAVSVQFYASPPHQSFEKTSGVGASPKIVSYVSKNCFWPAPKIDSAIIKITPFGSKPGLDPNLFFKIAKAGFSQPRKQLAGNLSKILKLPKEQANKWLIKNNINPSQRAETLSIEDWKNLTTSFGSKPGLDPKEMK
jgi:16S rRNA (adenine1518-N6/adenine1519-N6)-dimethyltransferase